jgi:hypothetical protein
LSKSQNFYVFVLFLSADFPRLRIEEEPPARIVGLSGGNVTLTCRAVLAVDGSSNVKRDDAIEFVWKKDKTALDPRGMNRKRRRKRAISRSLPLGADLLKSSNSHALLDSGIESDAEPGFGEEDREGEEEGIISSQNDVTGTGGGGGSKLPPNLISAGDSFGSGGRTSGAELYQEVYERIADDGGLEKTSILRLVNISRADTGRYQCVVSNGMGSLYSKKSRVVVYGQFLTSQFKSTRSFLFLLRMRMRNSLDYEQEDRNNKTVYGS